MSAQPYDSESDIREAIRVVLLSATPAAARAEYFARLTASGTRAALHARILLENMRTRSLDLQHEVITMMETFARERIDYSASAESLASHLNTPDNAMRTRITALVVNLGSRAKPAEDFALGCLRNQNRSIVMSGLLILEAIGRHCSKAIQSRLQSALTSWRDDEEIAPLFAKILAVIQQEALEHVSARRPSSSAAIRVSFRKDSFAGKTALLVEANDVFRESMALALRATGLEVIEAVDAEMVLELVKDGSALCHCPDVLILDIMLPGKNGVQLLQELRRHERCSAIPAITLGSIDRKELVVTMRAMGVRDYLLKPVRVERLLAAVGEVLLPTS